MACYSGLGNLADGRPFWVADFTGDGSADVLFYYPGDDNWWLGSISGGALSWQLIGNTAGFGHGINDGRPFWVADFTGDGSADVLFYYPGDGNWWLGSTIRASLSWRLLGNSGQPFSYLLRLHVKIVDPSLAAAAAPNLVTNSVANIQSLYGSLADILVQLVSTENLPASASAPATVNVGGCSGKTTGQQDTLFRNRNNVEDGDVVVYFVTATVPAFERLCNSSRRSRRCGRGYDRKSLDART